MTRSYVVLMAAIVSVAVGPAALHAQSPKEVRVGFTPLTLVAEGSRTDQLGGETLYTVAIYAVARPRELADLARADAATALRIEVASDDDPVSPLTRPWRRELVPRLNPAAVTQLSAIVGTVRKGDVVSRGQPIGSTGTGSPGATVPHLHFGAKLDGEYVDPILLLAPLGVQDLIRLVPILS